LHWLKNVCEDVLTWTQHSPPKNFNLRLTFLWNDQRMNKH